MTFCILSLDGGGIRGLIAARWLAELERRTGKPLRESFDLIAGTSTGSLLACGIAAGLNNTGMEPGRIGLAAMKS